MPVYNASDFLRYSLVSVLNQSFRDFEMIIVDDGSTDNSISIITELQDSRVRLITQMNKGTSSTYNVGIENSNADYVYFFDHDDYLPKNFLELCFEVIEHTNFDCYISNKISVESIDKVESSLSEITNFKIDQMYNNPCDFILEYYSDLSRYGLGYSNKIFRHSVISKIGFDETKAIVDFSHIYHHMNLCTGFCVMSKPIFVHLIVDNSLSRKKKDIKISKELIDSAIDHIMFKNECNNQELLSHLKINNFLTLILTNIINLIKLKYYDRRFLSAMINMSRVFLTKLTIKSNNIREIVKTVYLLIYSAILLKLLNIFSKSSASAL
jgi:glycosyltransferase involved in cell wall biosynthesis